MRTFLAFFASLLVSFTAAAQSFPPTPRVLLAVNPLTNKIYVLNESANSVTVLDAANNTSKTITVGSRPQFIAVNPLTNRIYVNNGGEASVTVIDGATDTNITPTPLPVGSQGPMAINAETNVVYIVRMTSLATDEVTYLNGNDNTWYTIATESFQPTALTINPITNTLYVAHYGTGDVRVISGANTGNAHPTTFSIPAWSHPFAIAANPANNQVYVLTEDSRGPIGIIDGATRMAQFPVPAAGHGAGPKAVVVNPTTGVAYAAFNGEVIAITGTSYTYIPVATGSGQVGLAVNALTNKIYVSSDGGTLTIIDGDNNTTTTVAIPAGAQSVAVNPVTNKVIVHGPTPTIVEGTGTPHGSLITTSITAQPGNSTGPNPTFTLNATNFSSNPLPIRGVFVQMDGRDGAWTAASGGGGAYSASFSGLTNGPHTLNAFAVEGQVARTATGPESMPLVGALASYTFTVANTAKADPTVSLLSSGNPSNVGQSVTFTASVTGTGTNTPTGTMEFKDGATTLCAAVTITSGSATCSSSALAPGAHTISATYSGDTNYNTASGVLTQTVNKAASTTTVTASVNPSNVGQSVTFTAAVAGGAGTATGTVTFTDGAATLCSAVLLVSGNAQCTTSTLSAGAHSITANYSGDASYSASTSALSQSVQAGGTNVALASAGAVATASSTYSSAYAATMVNDNERSGLSAGMYRIWTDATPGAFPDWVQIDFNGSKTIDRVVVYSMQDAYWAAVEPNDAQTFATYGAASFTVQGWDGANWVTLATVAGNNLVKRTVSFSAFTTTRIRVNVTGSASGNSNITEVEAWGVAASGLANATNVALASTGAVASASSAYSSAYAATMVNDNERTGKSGGVYRIWTDATPGAFPDWVQIDFNGSKTIDHVVVYSMQDAYWSPVEPGDGQTFATYGASSFTVQGWDGANWVTLETVTGNNLVKRTVSFNAFTTTRIRVNVTGSASGNSNITEVEAWGVPATGLANAANVALASTGAVATASSAYSSAYAATMVNDNERSGLSAGMYRIWTDATPGAFPDWVQIDFNGSKTIDRVVVYSMQDAYWSPVEPEDAQTFATYGASSFTVEGWDGASWVTLGTVSGNNLVKRTVSFNAFTTTRIRVNVTGSASGNSNITEVEAWGVPATGLANATNVALASTGAVATASSAYSSAYAATMVNDNERTGLSGGAYRIWTDATPAAFPDWVQIDFNGPKTIDRVVVYSMQDAYWSAVEPSDAQTFATYGGSAFTVQGWDGANWVTLGTVTGNSLVKRTVSFAPYTTSRIRINVTASPSGNSNITEIEAWGV